MYDKHKWYKREIWNDIHVNEHEYLLYLSKVSNSLLSGLPYIYRTSWGGQRYFGHGDKAGQLPILWLLSPLV